MAKLYAKLYSCPCVHLCVSFPLRLSPCHEAIQPGQDPKSFCSEGFVKAPPGLRSALNHFLKCFPYYILKPLTLLTTVTHSGAARTLSAFLHHPTSKSQEEVYHLLPPDHPNTYRNSGDEVVP